MTREIPQWTGNHKSDEANDPPIWAKWLGAIILLVILIGLMNKFLLWSFGVGFDA